MTASTSTMWAVLNWTCEIGTSRVASSMASTRSSECATVTTSAPGQAFQTYITDGKFCASKTTFRRGPDQSKQEATTHSATLTFGSITTEPGGAPSSGASWSPTETGVSHQPFSVQARTPRVANSPE